MTGHVVRIHRRRTGHYRFRAKCTLCGWLSIWVNQDVAELTASGHAFDMHGSVEFTLVTQ